MLKSAHLQKMLKDSGLLNISEIELFDKTVRRITPTELDLMFAYICSDR